MIMPQRVQRIEKGCHRRRVAGNDERRSDSKYGSFADLLRHVCEGFFCRHIAVALCQIGAELRVAWCSISNSPKRLENLKSPPEQVTGHVEEFGLVKPKTVP